MNVARNRITDLAPLFGMRSLVRLNLTDNVIADLSPLAGLPALRSLDVNTNQIASLAGLPTSLTDVNVSHNPLLSLVGLPVAGLQRLSIAQTQVSDLAPLSAATQLATLDISETLVIDAAPLQHLPITWLRVQRASLFDPATISIVGLRRLQLSGGPLAVPERLPAPVWQSLQQLEISSPISAWPAVQAPELHELQLANCHLTEVGGLPALTALRRLEIRGNKLRSIESLSALTNLTRLDVRNNQLTNLGAIVQKPPAYLWVVGNPLSVETCRELIAVGRRTQRLDLLWQGASTLLEVHNDEQALREVALSYGGRRYAIYFASERFSSAAAKALAARVGGTLAVIPDAALNQRLARTLATDGDPWIGLTLTNAQLLPADGIPVSYHAAMPPLHFRGYRGLPADGGQVVLLENATWGLSLQDLSNGVVIEWPSDL